MSYVTNKMGSSHWAQTKSAVHFSLNLFLVSKEQLIIQEMSFCPSTVISAFQKEMGLLSGDVWISQIIVIFIPRVSWANILTWVASAFTPEPSCWLPLLWILTKTKHYSQAFATEELIQHKSATSFSSRTSAVGWKLSAARIQCVSKEHLTILLGSLTL